MNFESSNLKPKPEMGRRNFLAGAAGALAGLKLNHGEARAGSVTSEAKGRLRSNKEWTNEEGVALRQKKDELIKKMEGSMKTLESLSENMNEFQLPIPDIVRDALNKHSPLFDQYYKQGDWKKADIELWTLELFENELERVLREISTF